MTDLATLGLAVDSSQVKEATTALVQFRAASAGADQASQQLALANGKLGPTYQSIESMAKRAGISVEEQARKIMAASQITSQSMTPAMTGLSAVAQRGMMSFNYISLALQGVTAAATAYYAYVNGQQTTAEQALSEQARLLGVIRDAYDNVTRAATRWTEQSRDVTLLQTLQQINDLTKKMNDSVGASIMSATKYGNIGDFFTQTKQIKDQFLPFEDALFKLFDGFKSGTPDVRGFVDEVARIALLNPALQAAGATLISSFADPMKWENAIEQAKAFVAAIKGLLLTDDQKNRIGGGYNRAAPVAARDPFDMAVNSANRHIAAMEADARSVGAAAGMHERLRVEAQLLTAAQRDGATATDAQKQKIAELGQKAEEAARRLARARVTDNINFDRATSLLSQEDVQIAQQLRTLYPDVATALSSVEAAAMRTNNAMRTIGNAIENNLTNGLTDIVSGTKSVSDGFRDMSNAIIREIERMIIQLMIVRPLMMGLQGMLSPGGGIGLGSGLMGGGSPTGYGVGAATGGLITGPGTGTSDSILARVSNGEFVVNAAATAQHLPLLQAINDNTSRLPRFAAGGLAGGGGGGFGKPVNNFYIQGAQSQPQIEAKPNRSGGQDIQIVFRDMIRGVLAEDASMGGPISKQMGRRMAGFNGS